jgi:hypothetical protein
VLPVILLLVLSLPVGRCERITYSLKEKSSPTELQKKIFTTWLGEKKFDP